MCGRYHQDLRREAENHAFSLLLDFVVLNKKLVADYQPPIRYNIAPTQEVATIAMVDGLPHLRPTRWGLQPSWAKQILINTRSDSLLDANKRYYRALGENGRCIIPASGFYEWKRTSGKPIPFNIHRQSGKLMYFAGILEVHGDQTYNSIITTDANDIILSIHDRMPVILSRKDAEKWLDHDLPLDKVGDLLHPSQDDDLALTEVGMIVNDVRNDGPECLLPAMNVQGNLFD